MTMLFEAHGYWPLAMYDLGAALVLGFRACCEFVWYACASYAPNFWRIDRAAIVLIWDNPSLWRSANLTDPPFPRTLYRITVKEFAS